MLEGGPLGGIASTGPLAKMLHLPPGLANTAQVALHPIALIQRPCCVLTHPGRAISDCIQGQLPWCLSSKHTGIPFVMQMKCSLPSHTCIAFSCSMIYVSQAPMLQCLQMTYGSILNHAVFLRNMGTWLDAIDARNE